MDEHHLLARYEDACRPSLQRTRLVTHRACWQAPDTPQRVGGLAGAVVGALGSTVEGLANQLAVPAETTAMDALRCGAADSLLTVLLLPTFLCVQGGAGGVCSAPGTGVLLAAACISLPRCSR